jgi:hypothetical protein
MEDLSHLAPPTPSLADATVLAPERDGSNGPSTPTFVLSKNEEESVQSPPTLIPATDTLSTRPTRGGVAYPFTLRVDGERNSNANASMLTLQSMNLVSPGLEVERKELGFVDGEKNGQRDEEAEKAGDRPGVERFVTADIGTLSAANDNVERPGVERFETAREDLSTLADSNGKA